MINRNLYLISVVFILLSVNPFVSADDSRDLMIRGIDCFNSAYNHWDEKEFLSSLDLFKEASRAGQNTGQELSTFFWPSITCLHMKNLRTKNRELKM